MTGGRLTKANVRMLLACLAALSATAALLWHNLAALVPPGEWIALVTAPDPASTPQMIALHSFLPRVAASLLAGGALALSGTILQHVLKNPLAEPATLGVSAGAQLALTLATLWAPALLSNGPEWPAMAGAFAAFAAVLGLSASHRLSPVTVALTGMVVSLYCSMAGAVVTLFNHDLLIGLFLWGAGYLDQSSWSAVLRLLPMLVLPAAACAFLLRPLMVLALADESARSLGLPVTSIRLLAMGLAVALAALVTASFGIISFAGLAAPAIARLSGCRTLGRQMLAALLAGSILLLATDQLILALPTTYRSFPTGAMTALLGAPVLMALLPRLKALEPLSRATASHQPRAPHPWCITALAGVALIVICALSLSTAGGSEGLIWGAADEILPFRLPRLIAAVSGGAAMALAGCLLQRMTGNPLASPEVLGVSSGAILGTITVVLAASASTRLQQIAGGVLGALLVLALLLILTRRSAFSGTRLLLAGIGLSSLTGLVTAVLMTLQDPRLGQLLAWLSGSTYQTGPKEAFVTACITLAGTACLPMMLRWLAILPLGMPVASSLGVARSRANVLLLLMAAILSAAATLTIGPLTFAGILGPQFARACGLQRPASQTVCAMLFAAAALAAADWLGRVLIFPWQIPAGLLTALTGGPIFLIALMRRR